MLDSDQPENGLKFLQHQINKSSQVDQNDGDLNKLKNSYDTLVKFSFLTHDDEEFTRSIARESRDQYHNMYQTVKLNRKPSPKSHEEKRAQKVPVIARRNSFKDMRKSPPEPIAEDDEEKLVKNTVADTQSKTNHDLMEEEEQDNY